MEGVYLSCLAGGLMFAIVTVVLGDWLSGAAGGILDFLSFDGHHSFQPMAIVGGVTVFGGTGLMLQRYTPLHGGAAAALSALCAALAAIAVYFVYIRPMKNSENSTAYSLQKMTGLIAEVLVPIPSQGYGEVLVSSRVSGNSNHVAASSEGTDIPSGARVVVVEVKDGTLYVAPFEL